MGRGIGKYFFFVIQYYIMKTNNFFQSLRTDFSRGFRAMFCQQNVRFLAVACCMMSAFASSAQTEYNLFPSSVVDADGWIWFDTKEKIDRYIGVIDETNFKVDPNGKLIQLVYADIMPDYPPSEASADFVGAGKDAEIGSEGCRTGGMKLQPSSAAMTLNGGGFIVRMPSCSTFSLCYSCTSKVMARIVASTNDNASMADCNSSYALDYDRGWKIINATYTSVFKRLPSGINLWSGIEKLNNGSDNVTIVSETPINVWFQSGTKDDIFIHGIKVTTPKQETAGIADITMPEGVSAVYTIDGKKLSDADACRKGVYIFYTGGKARKIIR